MVIVPTYFNCFIWLCFWWQDRIFTDELDGKVFLHEEKLLNIISRTIFKAKRYFGLSGCALTEKIALSQTNWMGKSSYMKKNYWTLWQEVYSRQKDILLRLEFLHQYGENELVLVLREALHPRIVHEVPSASASLEVFLSFAVNLTAAYVVQ